MKKYIRRKKGYGMSATSDITMGTRMTETYFFQEIQISTTEIMKLLTPGRAANPPGDVTLVPVSLVGVTVN